MIGILAAGTYLPRRRLDRAEIAAFLGTGAGRGSRTVASYDEDTTTLGVAAARRALAATTAAVDQLWFATAEPAWLEKTNATVIWAALRLPERVAVMDTGGAVRSGTGALAAALRSGPTTLVVTAGIRTGLAGGPDESAGGDGAAALLVGDAAEADLLAVHLGSASATTELIERWRLPGDTRTKQWEERLGEVRYPPLAAAAWREALASAGVAATEVARVTVAATHARAASAFTRTLPDGVVVDDLASRMGHSGAAHGALALCAALEDADPGTIVGLVNIADGADVVLVRRTSRPLGLGPTVAAQLATGKPVSYARYLQWRQQLEVQPPNRPEPARISAAAASRRTAWKYGFVGTAAVGGTVHLPPSRLPIDPAEPADMEPVPMADATGTIVTFTVDRLAYSQSPPVVFAVVDFDGGGRMPLELTDCDAGEVQVGARVGLSFRRLATADGIHNYFWKGVLL